MNTQSDFAVVNDENVAAVSKLLREKRGSILIADRGFQSGRNHVIDARFDLFDSPVIEGAYISVKRGVEKRGREDWQTGWEKDRQYLLRPKPEPSGDPAWDSLRSFSASLEVGEGHEFKIGFQSTVCRGTFAEDGVTIFLPRSASPEAGFRFALEHMLERLRLRLSEGEIRKIIAYMLDDLKTGRTFMHNVQAGVDADFALGL